MRSLFLLRLSIGSIVFLSSKNGRAGGVGLCSVYWALGFPGVFSAFPSGCLKRRGGFFLFTEGLVGAVSVVGAAPARDGLSNLGRGSFRGSVGGGGASLFVLGGTRKVRITIAGCNYTVLSVVMPSGGNGCTGIMLKRSDVRRMVGDPRPFLGAAVKHCNGQVTGKGFALCNRRRRLTVGGNPGSLRNNPANFRAHM